MSIVLYRCPRVERSLRKETWVIALIALILSAIATAISLFALGMLVLAVAAPKYDVQDTQQAANARSPVMQRFSEGFQRDWVKQ